MSKKDFITVSEKHGVNPSMVTCFYCGEVTSIALLGKLPNDEEAPRQICMSVEPCDKCREKFKNYVLMVEKPSVDSDPTGRWFAIKKEVLPEEYRKSPVAYMLSEEFSEVIKNLK